MSKKQLKIDKYYRESSLCDAYKEKLVPKRKHISIKSKAIRQNETLQPSLVKVTDYPGNSKESNVNKVICGHSECFPPTPECDGQKSFVKDGQTPVHIMTNKTKLGLINSASKILHKKKYHNTNDVQKKSLHRSKVAAVEKTKTDLMCDNTGMKPSTKKLSFSKSLKRRGSYSPVYKDHKKINISKECIATKQKKDDSDMLSGYIGDSNINLESIIFSIGNQAQKPEETTLTNIKCKDSFDDLDDSLLDHLDEITDITEKRKKAEKIDLTDNIDVLWDDSLCVEDLDVCVDFGLEAKVDDPSVLLIWIVKQLRITTYEQSNGFKTTEKILELQLQKSQLIAGCHLRDDWFHMEIGMDDLVYVSGLSSEKLHCVLDNKSEHHIIIYPNTLISGTTIAAGISCERQAIFNERFKMEKQNEAMLLGTMTHDLFDWAMESNDFSAMNLENKARESLKSMKYLESLYAIGTDETEMLSKMQQYYIPIEEWWKDFVKSGTGRQMDFKTGSDCKNMEDCSTSVHIDKIVDIEENVWSPIYGLKGKIDASVNVTVHRRPRLNGMKTKDNYLLPLELKTGKMFSKLGSIEHRAQVAVYTLLLSDKYKQDIDTGLLCYIKSGHMVGVPRPMQEKRAILIKRNEIARPLTLERKDVPLPGLLRNERQCSRCYQNQNCMLYFKAMENGEAWSSGVEELFNRLTSHLTLQDLRFFSKWYKLSMLEASYSATRSKQQYVWGESSEDRERQGCCFSHMVIVRDDMTSDDKMHYVFQRTGTHFNCGSSLKSIPLVVGTRVIISKEKVGVFNITTGYIVNISEVEITVSVHHKIVQHQIEATYRIDKDETLSNYTTPLSNLCKLFSPESPNDEKLRKLIIQGDSPTFAEQMPSYSQVMHQDRSFHFLKAGQGENLDDIYSQLNDVQKAAINKCLMANDYVMILGMPGAGKSTTTACLVRALVSMGKSVLLTSYTHSAVDTILLKLLDVGFNNFLRIGQTSQIHEKIKCYSNYECTKGFTSTHEIRQFFNSKNVVATTCLGINHPIFMHKNFDVCIVDEASQITQPVCLGPIRYAKSFVLVGDHNQLPPLVQSVEARDGGLEISLFRYLTELHPNTVVTLDHQYRMNKTIMVLTNELAYDNKMKCGNQIVAQSRLFLPFYESVMRSETESSNVELLQIIDPGQPVVFLDTSNIGLKELKSSAHLVNKGEAVVVRRIVKLLLRCGLQCGDIGVMSPYRHQLKIIREELATIYSPAGGFIEVDTIDKYQIAYNNRIEEMESETEKLYDVIFEEFW